MKPRLNFFAAGPAAMQALASLDQHLAQCGLEASLMELVRLRASPLSALLGPLMCLSQWRSRHRVDLRFIRSVRLQGAQRTGLLQRGE